MSWLLCRVLCTVSNLRTVYRYRTWKKSAHLPWHQARIVFLAQFMRSLLWSRSCNFYRGSLPKQGSNRVQLSPNQALFCWLHLLLWTGWKRIKAEQLFWSLRLNASMVCLGTRQVSCIELYLAGRRTNKGLLIVVSSQRPDMMIEDYYQRWHIETLFGCLKSRGFDLEATHMTELDRMDKLMGILALAFTWCLLRGQPHHGEAKHLLLNRHYRLAKSLFRLGLDMLRFQT